MMRRNLGPIVVGSDVPNWVVFMCGFVGGAVIWAALFWAFVHEPEPEPTIWERGYNAIDIWSDD